VWQSRRQTPAAIRAKAGRAGRADDRYLQARRHPIDTFTMSVPQPADHDHERTVLGRVIVVMIWLWLGAAAVAPFAFSLSPNEAL
jgi:hypothetical protein